MSHVKKSKNFSLVILLLIGFSFTNQLFAQESDSTIVERYGQLRVEEIHIVNQNGEPVMLTGMSLYWSQWKGQYYNYNCIKWLRDDWKCTVVRAAMGIESNLGYLIYPAREKEKVIEVINAAIELGIYVIVDWHDHNAHNHLDESVEFFTEIATLYGEYPNVIYEIYNEPMQVSWLNDVKPYADSVVAAIRAIDPDNIIVIGSPTWSQDVDVAANNPVDADNIAYSLHYYAAYQYHQQSLRNKAQTALNKGVALFVTEFGMCQNTGDGAIDYEQSNLWFDFLESNKISWCKWSVADLTETSAVLKLGANANGGWPESQLSESGLFIRNKIRSSYESMFTYAEPEEGVDTRYSLKQNYPNPFNPTTIISYSIPQNSDVQLSVYSLLGERVASLFNGYEEAGKHEISFNGSDLPSGVYMYELRINDYSEVKKMVLLK